MTAGHMRAGTFATFRVTMVVASEYEDTHSDNECLLACGLQRVNLRLNQLQVTEELDRTIADVQFPLRVPASKVAHVKRRKIRFCCC